MNEFIFSRFAEKNLNNLDKQSQQRVILKLKTLKSHPQIYTILKNVRNLYPASHRLRIGTYRILLQDLGKNKFRIIKINHRKNIYQ